MEAMKLIDFLTKDFGFSEADVKCSFSGHRGYHVLLENEKIRSLDSIGRKEIVDYVTGLGIDVSLQGLSEIKGGRVMLTGPDLDETGWPGRIARGTYEFLLIANREDLRAVKLKEKIINEFASNRQSILNSWKTTGPWNLVKGVGLEDWKKIVQRGIENQAARVDTVVTTDIHRLIRLPGTLHGKTGLLKVSFPTNGIESFDPLKSAIAFKKGEVKLYVDDTPQFRLGEETFGPFNQQEIELPLAAALFLLCKEAARVKD